ARGAAPAAGFPPARVPSTTKRTASVAMTKSVANVTVTVTPAVHVDPADTHIGSATEENVRATATSPAALFSWWSAKSHATTTAPDAGTRNAPRAPAGLSVMAATPAAAATARATTTQNAARPPASRRAR